jgi:hypothetical protein
MSAFAVDKMDLLIELHMSIYCRDSGLKAENMIGRDRVDDSKAADRSKHLSIVRRQKSTSLLNP